MTTSIFFVPSPNSYHSRIRQSLSPRLPSAPRTGTRSQPSQQQSEKKTLKRNKSTIQQATPPPTPPVVETTRVSSLRGLLKKPLRKPAFISASHASPKSSIPTLETPREVIERRSKLPSPPPTPANGGVKKQVKPISKLASRIPRPVRLLSVFTPAIRSDGVKENIKETSICTSETPTESVESDVSEDVKPTNLSTSFTQFEEVNVNFLARRAAVVSQLSKGLPLSFRVSKWVDASVPSKALQNRLNLVPNLREALEESLKKRSQRKTSSKLAPVARPSPVPASPGGIFAELLRKVKPVEGSESLKSHLKKVENIENEGKAENSDVEEKRRARKIRSEADKHPEFLAELKGVLSNRTNTGPTAIKSDRIQIQTDLTNELKTAFAHRKSGSSPEIKVEHKSPQPESFQTPLPALRPLANAADKENATRGTSDHRITNSSSPAENSRSVASLVNRFTSGTKSSFNTHQESNSSFHPFAGARIRKLNVPELIDTERVSKDKDTQREIEALRIMRRVETGAVSLTKTRVFGGVGPVNACDEERGEGLSLKCVAILEKYRK